MQLIRGDEVLTLKFDLPSVRNARGRQDQKPYPQNAAPGSIVASVSPDDLMKTLPKRKGA